jgi:hypothetical protein
MADNSMRTMCGSHNGHALPLTGVAESLSAICQPYQTNPWSMVHVDMLHIGLPPLNGHSAWGCFAGEHTVIG